MILVDTNLTKKVKSKTVSDTEMDEGRKKQLKLGVAIALVVAFCGGLGGAVLYHFTSGKGKVLNNGSHGKFLYGGGGCLPFLFCFWQVTRYLKATLELRISF